VSGVEQKPYCEQGHTVLYAEDFLGAKPFHRCLLCAEQALSRRVAELEGALREAVGALDYFAEDDALAEDDGGVCDNLCGARVCDVIGCIRMKQNAARAALKGQG
jgi:hypothetical protein